MTRVALSDIRILVDLEVMTIGSVFGWSVDPFVSLPCTPRSLPSSGVARGLAGPMKGRRQSCDISSQAIRL